MEINTNLKFIHIYLQNNKINSMLYFLRYKYCTPVYISENTCTQTEKKTHTMKETDHFSNLTIFLKECAFITYLNLFTDKVFITVITFVLFSPVAMKLCSAHGLVISSIFIPQQYKPILYTSYI